MPYEVEETGENSRRAHVTVPAEEYEKRSEAALKELGEDVDLEGFRKGKVPMNILRKRFGSKVAPDVVQELVREHLSKVLSEENAEQVLHIGEPDVTNLPTTGGDLEFDIDYELKPTIEALDYSDIEVDKPEVEVTREEVDEQLEELRKSYATLEPINFREKIQEGDVVTLDLEAVDDDVDLAEEGVQITVGEEDLMEGIEDALIGAKFGSNVRATIHPDESFPIDEVRGEDVELDLRIQSVKQERLPELDDDFAKDTGEASTLLELRSQIKSELEEQKQQKARDYTADQVLDQLLEKQDIEIPEMFLEQSVEQELQRRKQYLQQMSQGAEVDFSDDVLGDEMREQIEGEVEQNLQKSFLLSAIADSEGLEVSERDIKEYFKDYAEQNDVPIQQLIGQLKQNEEQFDQVRSQILTDRVIDFILDNVETNPVDWSVVEQQQQEAEQDSEPSQ